MPDHETALSEGMIAVVQKGHQPGCGVAGVAQLVEHNVANVVVVGSNPITRSSLAKPFFSFPLAVEK
jgi:hypothetical protein